MRTISLFPTRKRLVPLALLLSIMCLLPAACSDDKEEDDPVEPPVTPAITLQGGSTTQPVVETGGGTTTVSFHATAAWTATVEAGGTRTRSVDWLSVQPTGGAAGDATITITTQPNQTYDERNAAVVLASGTASQRITVTQKQLDALLLGSSKAEVGAEGGDISLEVQANVAFTSRVSDEGKGWLTLKEDADTRGLTASTLTLTAAPNEGTERRQASVTLAGGGLEETLTVYQAGSEPTLVLTQREYTVGSAGETIRIELQSNTAYEMTLPDVDWISESGTRALSTYTHYLEIAPNEGYDSRTAEITFTSQEQGLTETVTITQVQKDALLVAQCEYEVAAEGGELSFTVQTNVELEASATADWIVPLPRTRGLHDERLGFRIEANGGAPREASIVVAGTGSDVQQTILVRQLQHAEGELDYTIELKQGREDETHDYSNYAGQPIELAIVQESRLHAADGTLHTATPQASILVEALKDTVFAASEDELLNMPITAKREEQATGDNPLRHLVAQRFSLGNDEQVMTVDLAYDVCRNEAGTEMPYAKPGNATLKPYQATDTDTRLAVAKHVRIEKLPQTRATEQVRQYYRVCVLFSVPVEVVNASGPETRELEIAYDYIGVVDTTIEAPDLVDVRYRKGYSWEEECVLMHLGYYAIVWRDREYSDGTVLTDQFVDYGHPIAAHTAMDCVLGSVGEINPVPAGVYKGYWGLGHGFIAEANYLGGTRFMTDSIMTITETIVVPSMEGFSLEGVTEDMFAEPGDWDKYSTSKTYPPELSLTGEHSSGKSNGWYFSNFMQSYETRIIIDWNYLLMNTALAIDEYDQYLLIDDQRIDFLDYFERPVHNYTLKDLPATDTYGPGKELTCTLTKNYMGRKFIATGITTVLEEKYDQKRYFYRSVEGDSNAWSIGSNVVCNHQPVMEADADWIHIEGVENLGPSTEYHANQWTYYNWKINYTADPIYCKWGEEPTEPTSGRIIFKDENGNPVAAQEDDGTYDLDACFSMQVGRPVIYIDE